MDSQTGNGYRAPWDDVIKRAQGYRAGSDGIKHFQQVNMKDAERCLDTDASYSAAPKALRCLSV
jgi:hypothetical protein